MVDEKGFVEVTVKLPKRLMQLVEEQGYFGLTKEELFVAAVRSIVSSQLSEMPISRMQRIYSKYGRNIDVVRLPQLEAE